MGSFGIMFLLYCPRLADILAYCILPDLNHIFPVFHIQHKGISRVDSSGKNLLRRKCFHILLKITLQRSCAVNRVITVFDHIFLCSFGKLKGQLL